MRTWILVGVGLLGLALTGCVAPADDGAADDGSRLATPTAVLPVQWTGCEQWHLHFDVRGDDFASAAPPGFTVSTDDQGLTTLFIHVTFCGDDREAMLGVPLVAPGPYADETRRALGIVQVFHSPGVERLYPAPFAPRLVPATFSTTDLPLGPQVRIGGGGEVYEFTLALRPSDGEFMAEHWARFAADGDGLGVVYVDGSPSTNNGYGPVTFRHEGPGGAPPATAGIGHRVRDLDIHFTQEVFV